MFIDSTIEDKEKGTETFVYKCPNSNCSNYGYKKEGEQLKKQALREMLKQEEEKQNIEVETEEKNSVKPKKKTKKTK